MAESLVYPFDYRSKEYRRNGAFRIERTELLTFCLGHKKNLLLYIAYALSETCSDRFFIIIISNSTKKISFMIIQRKLFFLIFACLTAIAYSFSYVLGELR